MPAPDPKDILLKAWEMYGEEIFPRGSGQYLFMSGLPRNPGDALVVAHRLMVLKRFNRAGASTGRRRVRFPARLRPQPPFWRDFIAENFIED